MINCINFIINCKFWYFSHNWIQLTVFNIQQQSVIHIDLSDYFMHIFKNILSYDSVLLFLSFYYEIIFKKKKNYNRYRKISFMISNL